MLLYEHSSLIDKLLGSNMHYRVPLYQRRYVWNEMNWDTLWKDILFQLKIKEQQEEENHPTHFMGPIVTRSIGKKAYEVIDGQQRLATFQIILCVIRDLCNTQDDPQKRTLARSAAKYIVNDEDVLIDDPDYEFTFNPTEHDRPAFSLVTSKEYGKNRTNSDGHSILKAYDHFSNLIQEYVGDNLDFEKMRRLFRSITDRFSFIHINLRSEDEHPAKVFASINATGRKLSEFDYLRNDLFLRAENKAEDFYEAHWDFEKDPDYWKEHRLDSFFRRFLMAKQGPDCFEKNVKPFEVYQQYREELTTGQGIKYEFQELSRWANSYRQLRCETSFKTHERFCKDLNLRDLDSFLLYVKHNQENDLNEVCWLAQSYIVRRMLVLEDATYSHTQIIKSSYKAIDGFFSSVMSDKSSFSKDSFAKCLYNSCGGWPDDKDVATAFENVNSKNADFITYMFYQMTGNEEQRYGQKPLNWGLYMKLLQEIADLLALGDGSDGPVSLFSSVWPSPSYFL
ncbi:MAG: DUF262 domain-containing protein [Candidatus Poribacteria bacterium]|nr:DUF262 domain-containing protein [Candidatus Poribacteria bacterium]